VAGILGRKHIYGYEVLILAIGAIASAFSPNYTLLLISRAVLGIGIGGDYPVSATIMNEYAGKNARGRMVGAVFANQAAGLIVGPLIASIFLASGLSDNLTWRLLLGLGAIPGLAVFYLRRQIHETPRFAMAGGAAEAAIAAAGGWLSCPRGFGCRHRARTGIFGGTAQAGRAARCWPCPPGRSRHTGCLRPGAWWAAPPPGPQGCGNKRPGP
jgi:MFS family permease